MKNKILMSLVTMLITTGAANAFEIGGVTFFEKPIQDKYLSVSNGGTLPDNQALKDGVGVIIVSSPVSAENRVDTTLNNKALLSYADLAAEEGVTVKNYIATNDVDPDLKTAVLSNTLFTADTTADTAGDNPLDPVILSNGTVTCANAQVGDTLTNGYLVVDRNLLDNAINNGEDFSKLCTTHVSDMSFLFESRDVNYDITKWDVSNVTNMDSMFASSSFNQPIGNWDVSNVTNMSFMFGGNYYFNQPIGNWDVSNVTVMDSIFYSAADFNQDLTAWNVSNVSFYLNFDAEAINWEDKYKPNFP